MAPERIIVHVDMDAFFAAVEQRDRPELRGRPVVVGADPRGGKGRGVVSTCSYEARAFGIHSAMPISEAWRRCPDAAFVPVRGEAYAEVSRQVRVVFDEFSPDVEPISIDEAFLDVTHTLHLFGAKAQLAERIHTRIEAETQLTGSLGMAPSKFIAKIASDLQKPRGTVIVEPGDVESFLRPLAVGKVWGVGKRMQVALRRLDIHTIGDLADCGRAELERQFGKAGDHLWRLAHGQDDRPVAAAEGAKSISAEHTFGRDTADARHIAATLMDLCEKVAYRVRQADFHGRTVTLKVRTEDFTTVTRSKTVDRPMVNSASELYAIASASLRRVSLRGRQVRLIGVGVSGHEEEGGERQLDLFDLDKVRREREAKERLLGEAIDDIKNRFGQDAVRQAASLDQPDDEAD
ncbi:DNA polymerase IV [bacterium]|nr:DNA polymerase IV [bacterium]